MKYNLYRFRSYFWRKKNRTKLVRLRCTDSLNKTRLCSHKRRTLLIVRHTTSICFHGQESSNTSSWREYENSGENARGQKRMSPRQWKIALLATSIVGWWCCCCSAGGKWFKCHMIGKWQIALLNRHRESVWVDGAPLSVCNTCCVHAACIRKALKTIEENICRNIRFPINCRGVESRAKCLLSAGTLLPSAIYPRDVWTWAWQHARELCASKRAARKKVWTENVVKRKGSTLTL